MSFVSRWAGWIWSSLNHRSGDQVQAPITSPYEDSTGPAASIDTALQVSTVWACIDLLAKTVGSMPVYVYKRTKEKRELDRGSYLWELLHEAPNRRHTSTEFWRLMAANYFLRGNAYARIGMIGGLPGTLYPLMADQMSVAEAKNGALTYTHELDGVHTTYSEDQILHIRGPGNGVVGMSRLDFMRQSVNSSIAATDHAERLYRQKGRRQGVLTIDRVLSKEQRLAVQKNFGEMLAGDKTLAVLEAGFNYQGLGMSPADMQLMETKRFSVEELCRWFGVPSVLVNDMAKTTDLGSSVSEIIEAFSKFTVRPELVNFEQAIRKQLVKRDRRPSVEIEFGMDALLRASLKDRAPIYATMVQNGIYSRNEARQYENLPPDDNGDTLTVQANLTPLEKVGEVINSEVSNNGTEATVAQ